MKTLIYNEDGISENEIDETVTRVKLFIINEKNEIIIALSNGGIQLPGGHVEKDETMAETIIREVLEETGIQVKEHEILPPFLEIKYYTKNYNNTGENRVSNVIYYVIRTNKEVDTSKMNLTEREKDYKFSVKYVTVKNFCEFVASYIDKSDHSINNVIIKEILVAFNELTKNQL